MKSGVFFERDGVLNLVRVEREHPVTPLTFDQFHPNLEAKETLVELKAAGFVVLATTNQPGLSRGYQSRRELDRMHTLLLQTLPLDGILVCPHDETDSCPCHKPKPGLFDEAAFRWHLDLDRSFVVSDKWPDAQAAQLIGATSILLRSPWNGTGHHDFVLTNLRDAAQKILRLHSSLHLYAHHA